MDAEQLIVTNAYLEHLTATDLALLGSGGMELAGEAQARDYLRSNPERLDELLGSRAVTDGLFSGTTIEPLLSASPFLVFAVCVQRAALELESATYVAEWLGPGKRAPVFDVEQLRGFIALPRRRLFLAELLASYTHVASGSIVQLTRRGLRRQRFSELDPVRFAGLLDVVPDEERPGILRRLGDLALFLTGVFPDYVARRGFGPIEQGRLVRSGLHAGGPMRASDRRGGPNSLDEIGAVGLLDVLGRRWYRAAFDLFPRPVPANLLVVGELPELFGQARRILGLITERFLFSHRGRWFGFADD
jgi:hypothetical protein